MCMRMLRKVCVGAAMLAVTVTAASAQPLDASFSFVSDPGDWVGAGETRSFTLDTASISMLAGQGGGQFRVSVFPFAGGWWYVNLSAPIGSQLLPGAYEGAARFNGPDQPGLDVYGDGRGCNSVTGRFDVLESVLGPNGYFERFHARFEQHCEGGVPAMRGEIFIVNPPPPPPLEITLSVNGSGRAGRQTGVATVTGTLKCTIDAPVNLTGNISQRLNRFALATSFSFTPVLCTQAGTPWTLVFQPQGNVPFGAGMAQLTLSATGYDAYYGNTVTVGSNTAVKLTPK